MMKKIVFPLILALAACAHDHADNTAIDQKKNLVDVIPMTTSNIQGMIKLHEEGLWFFPATEKTLTTVGKNFENSRQAMERLLHEVQIDGSNWSKEIAGSPKLAAKVRDAVLDFRKHGHKLSDAIDDEADTALTKAKSDLLKAWSKLTIGHLTLGKRTKNERESIGEAPKNLIPAISNDFKDLRQFVRQLKGPKKEKVAWTWKQQWNKAESEFQKEYERSGEQSNSLMAIPYVLWGHIKALYYAIITPAAKTTAETVEMTAKVAEKILLAPTSVVIASGRTIFTLGGVFYQASKIGVELVSPYFEASVLGTLGMAEYLTGVTMKASASTMGLINQVAVTSAAYGTQGAVLITDVTAQTSLSAARMFFNFTNETSQVIFQNSKSALVIGYAAISALPLQTILAGVNSVFFLAWDGPRLIIATIKGEIEGFDPSSLFVGDIVDFKKLGEIGAKVEVVSDDPLVIKSVLEAVKTDLKEGPHLE